jgi:hypothetical protein
MGSDDFSHNSNYPVGIRNRRTPRVRGTAVLQC